MDEEEIVVIALVKTLSKYYRNMAISSHVYHSPPMFHSIIFSSDSSSKSRVKQRAEFLYDSSFLEGRCLLLFALESLIGYYHVAYLLQFLLGVALQPLGILRKLSEDIPPYSCRA